MKIMSERDTVDLRIVDCLMEDGRMSCAQIAERVDGVSERVVRYRLSRLIEQELISIRAIPNPKALGYPVVADVILQVEPGLVNSVAQTMAGYECTSYVGCSLGERDVSVQIFAHDNAELYSFVTNVIGKVPGVQRTSTFIVPVVLKDVYQWRIPRSTQDGEGEEEGSREPGGRVPERG